MEKFFKVKESGSAVRTEIVAGMTTFFAMAYIVLVAPNQLTNFDPELGKLWNAVYVASILVAVVGTLLMALYAKMPYAQACGMGLLSVFSVCFILPQIASGGDVVAGYQAGLVTILLSGILPDCIKKAMPAGIGLFIAFIGFQNVGIIQDNPYTLTQFVDIHGALASEEGFAATALPAVLALLGFLIIAVLEKKRVKGGVMIGIIVITVLYYLCSGTAPSFDMGQMGQTFKDFAEIGFLAAFRPESWANAFSEEFVGGLMNGIIYVFVFCLVNMFDTIGTLYGVASQADMLDEKGDPQNLAKAMTCDSLATVAAGVLGTSTGSTYVESSAGVAAGGRTGLTSLVTAICFALCLFLAPLASIVPACATAPALIYVGVLMLGNIKDVDLNDMESAVPAFLTLIMMPLSYSIANGIGIGCISYILLRILSGHAEKKDWVVGAIAVLFIIKFVTISM